MRGRSFTERRARDHMSRVRLPHDVQETKEESLRGKNCTGNLMYKLDTSTSDVFNKIEHCCLASNEDITNAVLQSVFGEEDPPCGLEVINKEEKFDGLYVVVKRTYKNKFVEKQKAIPCFPVEKPKKKRRWRSLSPVSDRKRLMQNEARKRRRWRRKRFRYRT